MSSLNIKPTTNPAILKFEAGRFLTEHQSYELKNIEEAAISPIAQQLFHFPFVKTVYIAQNFIAVEKFNIVEWPEVQEEVKTLIADFVDKNAVIKTTSNEKPAVSIYAESTPNPEVLKFVANIKLALKPTEFETASDAEPNSLPAALFSLPFVKKVFADDNYVSVTKVPGIDWNDITQEVRYFILEQLQKGKKVGESKQKSTTESATTTKEAPKPKGLPEEGIPGEIVAILEEYIKPAVAGDGGNILFDSYDEEAKHLKVILQGACSGCPSSTVTLKNGIEQLLREMLPGKVEQVSAVNG